MSNVFPAIVCVLFVLTTYSQTPRTANDFNKRGLGHFERGEYDGAVADFTKAIDISSRLTRPTHSPISKLSGDGETLEDALVRARVRVVDPRTATYYVNRGRAYVGKNNLDGAISDFSLALSISPGMVAAYYCRGTAWLAKRDYGRALADYDRALSLQPNLAVGYIGRGMVRLDQGDLALAFSDFDHAIKLEPKNAEFYYQRGDARYRGRGYAYFRQGKVPEAEEDFVQAVKLMPALRSEIDLFVKAITSK